MDFVSVQAIALAWATYMLIATIWYAKPAFGDLCSRLSFGDKRAEAKVDTRAIVATTVGPALALLFFAVILQAVACATALEGVMWGLAFGLFFDSGLNASHAFFEDRPVALFAVHRGCHAVGLAVVGGLLGLLCGGGAE